MANTKPIDTQIHLDHEPELNKFFKAVVKAQASDLHIKVGQAPKIRINGALKSTTGEPISEQKAEQLIFEIMTEPQKQYFLQTGTIEFAHEISESERFRINVFRQRGMISLTARRIESQIPSFESLHLPESLKKLADSLEGLFLVAGPSGCGKTTTVASLVDYINSNKSVHIITFDDPIEYLYRDKRAMVSQREAGIDFSDLGEALKLLTRQDADVVVISELRDSLTMSAAMKAAVTGHLVFGTMQAANVVQAVRRVIDLFPQDERISARASLSLAFRAVICQQLLPSTKKDIRQIPLVEILISNPIARKVIADSNEGELPGIIRSCAGEGMQDVTDALCQLVNNDYIDVKTAYEYAPSIEELKMALKGIRSAARGIM